MLWLEKISFPAVMMPRSLEWCCDTCWPVLDRAKFLKDVVKRNEIHVPLFVLWSLLRRSVETEETQHHRVRVVEQYAGTGRYSTFHER